MSKKILKQELRIGFVLFFSAVFILLFYRFAIKHNKHQIAEYFHSLGL